MSGQPESTTPAPHRTGPQRRPFTARRHRVVTITAIGALVAGSLAFWLARSGANTTIVRNGEIWLHGGITQTSAPPTEGGCSITVNGYEIGVFYGNMMRPRTPGTVTGMDACTDQTGRHADVYGQLFEGHGVSIWGAPRYYVRISGWTRTQDLIGLALNAAAVICVAIGLSKIWRRARLNRGEI